MPQLTTPVPETTAVPCPRCKQPLVDPAGLGWCKACGYCRSLAESNVKAVTAAEPTPATPNTVTATSSALMQTPKWVWITLVGIAVVAGATYIAGHKPTLTPLHRAMLTTIEIGVGILAMFLGQFMGVMKIAPDDPTLSFKDAVFPFRLYGLALKFMPRARHTIYLGAWGFAAIVSAAVFVGGLGHWFTYLPGYKPPPPEKSKKAESKFRLP